MHISEYVCRRRPFRRPTIKLPTAILLCVAALLAACETMAPASTPRAGDQATSELRPDAEYLAYLRALSNAGPSTQKNLYQQASDEYKQQANPHTRLRLALALSQLGAPHGNPAKARQLYKELLSAAQPLSPGLESLVLAQINELNHRITLDGRLIQLQQELDKANAKIQALTTIEKTLEQPIPEIRTKTTP